jgi:hypothetical protein
MLLCTNTSKPSLFNTDMEQTIIKKPNAEGRLFIKIDLQVFICLRPPSLCHTLYKYIPLYLLKQGRGEGGRRTSEKVRGALVHKRGRKYQHD